MAGIEIGKPHAEIVRLHLREQILSGELRAGERLIENRVAGQVGTSQGPVREAFARLSQEGLLISLPHRGTFVSTVSEEEARMAYALRSRIEVYAVEAALPRITEGFIQTLEGDLTDMREAALHGDESAIAAADVRFHGRFYELAGTEVLVAVWNTLSSTVRQFMVLAGPQYYDASREDVIDDHLLILNLVKSKNVGDLLASVTEHVDSIWERISAARPSTPSSESTDT